jgi:YHS domain-containing protein
MFRAAPSHTSRTTCLALSGAAIVFSLVASGAPALAGSSVNTGYFGGIAIDGYDPVAYFTDNRAVKGSERYSYEWLGTPWHFANDQHRELFRSDPMKYAPQYGGYCAGEVAGSGSTTVNIDPEAFKNIDGKLYLTYDKAHTADFAANTGDMSRANANWPKMKAELDN